MEIGTIALDIDGTITDKSHHIPPKVASYFENLHAKGWQFMFITGRPFSFATMALNALSFPYLLAVQNGADLLEMPSMNRASRSYISADIIALLDDLYRGYEGDFLIYSGYTRGDFCYFRPDRFSPEMQDYLKHLQKLSSSPWKSCATFAIQEQKTFPLIKCMGSKDMLVEIDQKVHAFGGVKTSIIKDPISKTLYLDLITHKDADKGIAAQKFLDLFHLPRPLIAAGDDNNDLPLLAVGDIRIAMEGGSTALRTLAQIVAPPADQLGIIDGLEQALRCAGGDR